MNKLRNLLCLYLITLAFTSSLANADTIRIATGEWPPYHSQNMDNAFVLRMIKEIFENEGISVEYGFFPWARAYNNVKGGQWHASASWEPENDPSVLYSDPLFEDHYVFFHLKDKPFSWRGWNNPDDLKQKHIGGTIEYHYGPEFDKHEKDKTLWIERTNSDSNNFRKLLNNHIDLFVNGEFAGYETLKTEFSEQEMHKITHSPIPVRTYTFHVIFAKNEEGKKYLAVFNRGLAKMKESGKIDAFINEAKKRYQ